MDEMTKKPRAIGEILFDLGRVTEADVERALAHQREHDVFFGEALVALGLATTAEIRFALADQYDIPFVRVHADEIDHDVATRVPAAWIRRHGAIPILRSGDSVTVLVTDPADQATLDELQELLGGVRLDLALSTPDVIEDLADAVHGQAVGRSVALDDFLGDAVRAGSSPFGVSMRGGVATGWFDPPGEGGRQRQRLDEGWVDALAECLSPGRPLVHDSGQRRWAASLRVGGRRLSVDCVAIGRGADLEWAARLAGTASTATVTEIDRELVEAVATLVRNGGGVVSIMDPGGELSEPVRDLLPAFPALVLGGSPRTLHIADSVDEETPGEPLAVPAQSDLTSQLDGIRLLGLDALTLVVHATDAGTMENARIAAPLVVQLVSREETDVESDIRVSLRTMERGLEWILERGYDGAD